LERGMLRRAQHAEQGAGALRQAQADNGRAQDDTVVGAS
jgi:hypothetical protein